MAKKKFQEFINRKFVEWEASTGKRQTITAFGDWLGDIYQGSMSHYMTGAREPRGEHLRKMVEKLGPEVYDYLSIAEPMPDDPLLRMLVRKMRTLPEEVRREIARDAARRVDEAMEQHNKQGELQQAKLSA
jgi:hypothetical protein